MKTDELIAHLASRATPVQPLPPPGVRVVAWSSVAITSAAAGTLLFGARPDLAVVISQQQFIWPLVAAMVTAAAAAWASLVLAVPGAERVPALRGSVLLFGGLWALMLVVFIARSGQGFAADSHWPICFIRVMAIGLPPAIVLFSMLRRAAPLRLTWTSALAATAAMAAGAIAVQLVCPLDDAAHGLLGHLGPVIALSLLGAAAARRLLGPLRSGRASARP